ncbi:MAG TPA: hypothetical protein VFE25_03980, partial [Opitutaceae bacterium]|nr:hypothetical protein [Opitutaceae bacterium]
MRASCLLLAVILWAAPGLAAAESAGLADAVAARSLLGPDTWCRIVRIENSAPRGLFHRFDYPRVVYATVFELSGILWFYTPTDGTQSLSLTTRTVERDERDPGALFAALYPGFTRWMWADQAALPESQKRPANACFVESVACLQSRLRRGAETTSPRLLSYYVNTSAGRLGHTVLVYGTSRGLAAIDPGRSPDPVAIPRQIGDNPMELSTFLRGSGVSSARTLSLDDGRGRRELLAQEAVPG